MPPRRRARPGRQRHTRRDAGLRHRGGPGKQDHDHEQRDGKHRHAAPSESGVAARHSQPDDSTRQQQHPRVDDRIPGVGREPGNRPMRHVQPEHAAGHRRAKHGTPGAEARPGPRFRKNRGHPEQWPQHKDSSARVVSSACDRQPAHRPQARCPAARPGRTSNPATGMRTPRTGAPNRRQGCWPCPPARIGRISWRRTCPLRRPSSRTPGAPLARSETRTPASCAPAKSHPTRRRRLPHPTTKEAARKWRPSNPPRDVRQ